MYAVYVYVRVIYIPHVSTRIICTTSSVTVAGSGQKIYIYLKTSNIANLQKKVLSPFYMKKESDNTASSKCCRIPIIAFFFVLAPE